MGRNAEPFRAMRVGIHTENVAPSGAEVWRKTSRSSKLAAQVTQEMRLHSCSEGEAKYPIFADEISAPLYYVRRYKV